MVTISRSTKPRPRHQPMVDALEERLALNVGAPTPPIVPQPPAAIVEAHSDTATPGAAVGVPFNGFTDYTPDPETPGAYLGTGIGTLTGRSTTTASVHATLDPAGTGLYSGYTSMDGSITTVSGDKIYFNATADFDHPITFPISDGSLTLTATGTAKITGGTGRFENATGFSKFTDEFTVGANGFFTSDHQTSTGYLYFNRQGS